jgi:signal transduction histidine kinase
VFGWWIEGTAAGGDEPGRFEAMRSVGARLVSSSSASEPRLVPVPVAPDEPAWSLAVEPGPARRSALDRWMIVAVIGGMLMASVAGLIVRWVVRGPTEALDVAVAAFEAVADGRADYDFPPSRDAALGELVASYSRMRRSLDRERERLRAVARVAAWKETARRVAHEVKNPLAPIRLTVENLVKARQRDPARFEQLFESGTGAILEEVDRLNRIVSEFSEYARLPEPKRRRDDIETILDSIVALYEADPNVEVRRTRETTLPRVAVDRDLIARAIGNVVDNAAREAAAQGGAIEIRTRLDGSTAEISVRDHGPGFEESFLPRVFEPYVTSREGGTGLGLAIAHRIVIEHGGTIVADNAKGGGAEVTIRLPVAGEEPA